MTEREYELDKTIEFYVRVDYKNERVSALKNPAKAKSTGNRQWRRGGRNRCVVVVQSGRTGFHVWVRFLSRIP